MVDCIAYACCLRVFGLGWLISVAFWVVSASVGVVF